MQLREYVGDMTRNLTLVADSMEHIFGHLYRVGGDAVYEIDGQHVAIYTMGKDTAIGLAWTEDQLVDSIYWWDQFSFYRSPDYEIDLPKGIDIETILPLIKSSIQNKTMGEISVSDPVSDPAH